MADIAGNFHCCDDCACAIANDDTSGIKDYRNWVAGVEATRGELPDGAPYINCPEDCYEDNAQEFMCDWCSRNVYSHKFDLVILN